MKRFITIILALIITHLITPNRVADQPPVTASKTPQTAITERVEQVEESEKDAETAIMSETEQTTENIETEEEVTSTQEETTASESIAIPQEPAISMEKEIKENEEAKTEETAECIDKGDQNLAEYKPQIGGQPNPFDNDTPTEIDDRPVEDYVGEGEDRPGEGLHF